MAKTFKNLLLQNPKSYDLEFWHAAFYKVYINDDPELTLTYFMERSDLVPYTFEWVKLLKGHLMEKPCSN